GSPAGGGNGRCAVRPAQARSTASSVTGWHRSVSRPMQHWLKVMHRFRGAEQRTVGDPHRLSAYGEPLMRPAYEPGDLALVYLAGTYRCPAVIEILAPAAYDARRRRWGWVTPVRVLAEVADLARAPALEE